MYHVPLPFQCIYECGEGGENGDRKKGSEEFKGLIQKKREAYGWGAQKSQSVLRKCI